MVSRSSIIRETETPLLLRGTDRHPIDVPRRRVSKRWKNARTYIYRAINQTRQGSPRIEHYLAHVETPVSDFVRLVRSLARLVLVTPPWHVLTPSCSHSTAQWPPVVLVAHFPSLPFLATPSITQSSLLSLSLSFSNSPRYPFLSPLQTHARLASSSFLALHGSTHPRRPSRSRSSDAHGAYNFHIVPSRSQPSAGERAAGSLAPVAARMKESGALWSPVGSQLHESHRAARTARRGVARRGAAAAPKILLRPRALGDRLKSRIMIIGARNTPWKRCGDWGQGIKRLN